MIAMGNNEIFIQQYPGELVLIAGDYTEKGDMSNIVYRNLPGIHCDIDGVICGGR